METIDLELIRIFTKVVSHGSFSKAALALKTPKSNVSKAIARLEAATSTKLLVRTTRSLTLTAAGRAFYDTCHGPIHVLEDAQKSLYGTDDVLSGHVRVTAPEDLGAYVISNILGDLTQKHPRLTFQLHYTDEVVDLVRDGFDLAIRLGNLKTSSLKAKKMGEVKLITVASSGYIKRTPKIRTPHHLSTHQCLCLTSASMDSKWILENKKERLTIKVTPQISSNQMTSLLKLAHCGAGVAFVPEYLCKKELNSGSLIHVLPEWKSPGIPVWIVTPSSSASSVRLKTTVDHLTEALQTALG